MHICVYVHTSIDHSFKSGYLSSSVYLSRHYLIEQYLHINTNTHTCTYTYIHTIIAIIVIAKSNFNFVLVVFVISHEFHILFFIFACSWLNFIEVQLFPAIRYIFCSVAFFFWFFSCIGF